jgi:hypothetical protein
MHRESTPYIVEQEQKVVTPYIIGRREYITTVAKHGQLTSRDICIKLHSHNLSK